MVNHSPHQLWFSVGADTRLKLLKGNATGIDEHERIADIVHDLLKFQHNSSIRNEHWDARRL